MERRPAEGDLSASNVVGASPLSTALLMAHTDCATGGGGGGGGGGEGGRGGLFSLVYGQIYKYIQLSHVYRTYIHVGSDHSGSLIVGKEDIVILQSDTVISNP